ncbi:hypothetical protein [Zooshikella ganghwensis]|uniref:Uncharacterized protein n=1 Tax=Zooshikella ganghwensis TaxID=202772 RepID=A0A4P9VGB6_9GAMM|nr:hypothetical protein [Zooshikella ganghwensis]RDH41456.1 hypothetical protein B9G39_28785 [Zooshikella ganghwensis]
MNIDQLESSSAELDKQATSVDSVAVYEQSKGFDLAEGPVGPIAPALLDQNKKVVPSQKISVSHQNDTWMRTERIRSLSFIYALLIPK